MDLHDRVAIVTGGAVRIGQAIALSLAEQGAKVCLHYGRSAQEADQTVTAITRNGGAASAVQADLSQPVEAARKIVAHAVGELGPVDVLVNSAAIFEPGTLATTSEETWDRHFNINLKAAFFLTQSFTAQLAPERQAHVVNILDFRASRPGPDHVSYTLTKSALLTLTLSLAQELAPRVQVNGIALGAILPVAGTSASHFERLVQQIPLRRPGSTVEVARALLFLLGSDFVTGEILHLTGGEHL